MEPRKHKIVFTFIVEFGDLENKSLLLAKSLRRFYKDANKYPIYAVRPRRGKEIKNSTKEQFKALDVIYVYSPVNRNWEFFDFANQVYGPAFIEERIDGKAEFMVYLDADVVCLHFPTELSLPDNCLVGITPVDIGREAGNDAAIVAEDSLNITWELAYSLAGVKSIPKWNVITKVEKLQIYPYFNSGFSIVRPEARIFRLCRDMFEMANTKNYFRYFNYSGKLLKTQNDTKKSSLHFIDQIFLAAAILSKCSQEQIKIFGNEYNFPFHFIKEIQTEPYNLEHIIFLHYHNMFYDLKWQSNVHLDTETREWLANNVPIRLEKHVSYKIKKYMWYAKTFIKWHFNAIKNKTESD